MLTLTKKQLKQRVKQLEACVDKNIEERGFLLYDLAEKIMENSALKRELEALKKKLPPVDLGDKLYMVDDKEVFEVVVVRISKSADYDDFCVGIERADGDVTPWAWCQRSVLKSLGICLFRTEEEAKKKLMEMTQEV